MKVYISIVFVLLSHLILAQPETEIYLLDLSFENDEYVVKNPESISNSNPGYDNQPSFSQDGQFLYYVATRGDQTDIVSVNILSKTRNWVSETSDGSEYSPTLSPDKNYIASVQLEKDGKQLLWNYSKGLNKEHVLIENAKIGYYCWVNRSMLAAFVLGEPSTLQLFDLTKNSSSKITENIGRSLHKIPGKSLISFIDKKEKEWMIKSLNPKSGKIRGITCSLTGSEDMAWTAEKRILMAKGSKLFFKNPKKDEKWIEISSINQFNYKDITRLAVSPDGKKLAIVVNEK